MKCYRCDFTSLKLDFSVNAIHLYLVGRTLSSYEMNSYVLINCGDNLRGYKLEHSHAPFSLIALCKGYSTTFW